MDALAKSLHRLVAVAAGLGGATVGYVVIRVTGANAAGRMLPWILGRGLGWAAYLCLVALTCLGLWLRHPWRLRWQRPAVEAALRVHAVLAALTGALLAGHVLALVLDRYAGVGWRGAVIPGASAYRPVPVAIGTVAAYLVVLVGATAASAGRLVRKAWLPVHRAAGVLFAMAWLHGVLAGSDTARLAAVYLGTGALVVLLAATRYVARSAPEVAEPAR